MSEEQLVQVRQDLKVDFKGVSEQLNKIESTARKCYESVSACEVPTEYYHPTVNLPEIGGDVMSIKQLEERLGELQRHLVELRAGIENGSIIAQKALMLQARDYSHWMRWKEVDSQNREIFEMWRADTNTWTPRITTNSTQTIAYSEPFSWSTSDNTPVKMWHSSRSIPFIMAFAGNFRGFDDNVNITIGRDGYWYLGGTAGKGFFSVTARCIGQP
jgi:hypothetical protein